jgi:hypothetical protein
VGRKCRRRSSQRRLDCEGSSSVAIRSEAEEGSFDSNDDFFRGRDRAKVLLEVEDDEVGEKDLWPFNRVGLETGDSVMTAPNRNPLLESLEGELSLVGFVEADDVRERG